MDDDDDLNPLTKWPDILDDPNVQVVSKVVLTWDRGYPMHRSMTAVQRIEPRSKPTILAIGIYDHLKEA